MLFGVFKTVALLATSVQGTMIDKHKIQLQLSTHGASAAANKASKSSKADKSTGSKLVVRNVAFEATKKDVMGLFGPFGHIKSCRWGLGF